MRLDELFRIKPGKSDSRLNAIEMNYQRSLTELCMNRFKWSNLPPSVDKRFLEFVLFQQALAVFYKDTQYDRFMALRGAGTGLLNMYDNPVQFIVYGNTMINKTLNANQCVPIWANMLRIPDFQTVALYASRLAENDVSIDIASMNLREPTLIIAPEETRLSWKNVFQQKRKGATEVWGAPGMDTSAVQKFDMAGDVRTLEALQLSRARIWNDCMSMLGIDNANQEKKERLVSGEVDANNAQVSAYKAVALSSRQYACEQINAMYGLEVWVEYNTDVELMQEQMFTASIGGGVSNG